MNNDLISRSALKEKVNAFYDSLFVGCVSSDLIAYASGVDSIIDNAPTVDFEKLGESLRCQIRAEYGSCDDCELSCPRNELIKLLDSVEERPQGEWVEVEKQGKTGDGRIFTYTVIVCSECGEQYHLEGENFCPNCGASMKKAVRNDNS